MRIRAERERHMLQVTGIGTGAPVKLSARPAHVLSYDLPVSPHPVCCGNARIAAMGAPSVVFGRFESCMYRMILVYPTRVTPGERYIDG